MKAKRWLSAIATVAVLVAAASVARAKDDGASEGQKVYKQAVRSTVLVLVPVGDGTRARPRGSGSLIDLEHRLVLTAYHMMADDEKAYVVFPAYKKGELIAERDYYLGALTRGAAFAGRVIATDPERDLAVIQLDKLPKGVPALRPAQKSPSVGQRVYSIGNPAAAGDGLWVYTEGIVRQVFEHRWKAGDSKNEHVRLFQAHVIMTDSPVNPGDSGGPLLNGAGELIGIAHGFATGANLVTTFINVVEAKKLLSAKGLLNRAPVVTAARPAAPATAAKAAPESGDPERQAKIKLKMAQELAGVGLNEKAKARCEKLIAEYPNTAAAADAKKLLEKINEKSK